MKENWILEEQQGRLARLLLPHVKPEDNYLSDSELVYTVKKRFDVEWNRRQTLVDPNE